MVLLRVIIGPAAIPIFITYGYKVSLIQMNNKELLTGAIHDALKAWHKPGIMGDETLLDELQLVKRRQKQAANGENGRRLCLNEILLEALEQLGQQNGEASRLLRNRFLDGQTLREVAQAIGTGHHAVSRQQRAALEALAEVIMQQEMRLREKLANQINSHLLPASYDRLFGVAALQAELVEQLTAVSHPHLITILGIGGIGKTSLADAAVRQVIPAFRFDEVVWLRLEYQTLDGRSRSPEHSWQQIIDGIAAHIWPDSYRDVGPKQREVQVRHRLKQTPYLVVVDNLEAEDDTAYVLAHLNDLADPSKFLLTTRIQPAGETAVFTLSLSELSRTDAEALMRHHAERSTISLAEATAADFDAIYKRVGGNPLALKLVISLLRDISLPHVLDNLVAQRGQDIAEMYQRIYRRAWDLLTPTAQQLLRAMQLVSEEGVTAEDLQTIYLGDTIDETDFWPAIQSLRQRSLLEVRGSLRQRKYGIHRLTRTFLENDINP
jgi:hypothetical protein